MIREPVPITGIFLAAGRGRRFGANKLLHEIHSRPLISYGVQAALQSKLAEVQVVVGPGQDAVREVMKDRFANESRLAFVENLQPEAGMMSSLQAGLRSLPESTAGAMIFLGDMPWITPSVIDQLLSAFSGGQIVLPVCAGRRRHPRILPHEVFPDFLDLVPDQSGQLVLERHPDRIVTILFEVETCFRDVDRPGDLSPEALRDLE